MKKHLRLLFLFALSSLATIASASNDATLNGILQKHLDAMGGLRNWSQIESIRLSGTIERNGQTVDIVIIKKSPNQIRATVTIPSPGKEDEAFQVIRAHDGKTGWTATRQAGAPTMIKKTLTSETADDLLNDAGVLPLLIKHWRKGENLELIGSDAIDGEPAFVIDYTHDSRPATQRFYLSTKTYRTIAYETTTSSEHIRTTLSNYQEQHGVLLPTLSIITTESTGKSTMRMDSIDIGVGIYEEYFDAAERLTTATL
ncbi:hypothetical protein ACWPKO_06100 [Coraliomargarita sp. W4R53]